MVECNVFNSPPVRSLVLGRRKRMRVRRMKRETVPFSLFGVAAPGRPAAEIRRREANRADRSRPGATANTHPGPAPGCGRADRLRFVLPGPDPGSDRAAREKFRC